MFLRLAIIIVVSIVAYTVCADDKIELETPTITLDLKDIPVKTALEMVFKNSGKNFTIDTSVEGTIASLSFKNVSLDAAVNSITKTAGLTYRIDNNIYVISKKSDDNFKAPPVFLSMAGHSSENFLEYVKTSEIIIEKIQLNHISPQELLNTLGDMERNYSPAISYSPPPASSPYLNPINRRSILQNEYYKFNPYSTNNYRRSQQDTYNPYGLNYSYSSPYLYR